MIDGGPNAGFLRRNARLSVVFATDAPDCSEGSVLHYVEAYRRLKASPDNVLVAAMSLRRSSVTGSNERLRPER